MIHNTSIQERDRRTNKEINIPNCIAQYKKYMKGVDHADPYLSYCSIIRKIVKWSKKVALFLLHSILSNSFLTYKTLKKGTKIQEISS
jgi:hypothetical protein